MPDLKRRSGINSVSQVGSKTLVSEEIPTFPTQLAICANHGNKGINPDHTISTQKQIELGFNHTQAKYHHQQNFISTHKGKLKLIRVKAHKATSKRSLCGVSQQ